MNGLSHSRDRFPLFEMYCSREVPFEAASIRDLMQKIIRANIPRALKACPSGQQLCADMMVTTLHPALQLIVAFFSKRVVCSHFSRAITSASAASVRRHAEQNHLHLRKTRFGLSVCFWRTCVCSLLKRGNIMGETC